MPRHAAVRPGFHRPRAPWSGKSSDGPSWVSWTWLSQDVPNDLAGHYTDRSCCPVFSGKMDLSLKGHISYDNRLLAATHDLRREGLMSVPVLSPEDVRRVLAALPRLSLAHLPTPLDEAPRFAEQIGVGRVLIKRDDCTG